MAGIEIASNEKNITFWHPLNGSYVTLKKVSTDVYQTNYMFASNIVFVSRSNDDGHSDSHSEGYGDLYDVQHSFHHSGLFHNGRLVKGTKYRYFGNSSNSSGVRMTVHHGDFNADGAMYGNGCMWNHKWDHGNEIYEGTFAGDPVDVSTYNHEGKLQSKGTVVYEFPWVKPHGICVDYIRRYDNMMVETSVYNKGKWQNLISETPISWDEYEKMSFTQICPRLCDRCVPWK